MSAKSSREAFSRHFFWVPVSGHLMCGNGSCPAHSANCGMASKCSSGSMYLSSWLLDWEINHISYICWRPKWPKLHGTSTLFSTTSCRYRSNVGRCTERSGKVSGFWSKLATTLLSPQSKRCGHRGQTAVLLQPKGLGSCQENQIPASASIVTCETIVSSLLTIRTIIQVNLPTNFGKFRCTQLSIFYPPEV